MKKFILRWFDAIPLKQHRLAVAKAKKDGYTFAMTEIKNNQIVELSENELNKHKLKTVVVETNYSLTAFELAKIIANSKVVKDAAKDAEERNNFNSEIKYTIQIAIQSDIVENVLVLPQSM